jgi:hypothetical protein
MDRIGTALCEEGEKVARLPVAGRVELAPSLVSGEHSRKATLFQALGS